MAGSMSRNKGARGEREIIGLLQPIVDRACDHCGHIRLLLKRNYSQRFASKQYDVEGVPWMALEVKRVENLSGLGSWWRQVLAATREGQTPVLAYRQNHGKWQVRMRVAMRTGEGPGAPAVRGTVTVDWPTFAIWFEQKLIHELK